MKVSFCSNLSHQWFPFVVNGLWAAPENDSSLIRSLFWFHAYFIWRYASHLDVSKLKCLNPAGRQDIRCILILSIFWMLT